MLLEFYYINRVLLRYLHLIVLLELCYFTLKGVQYIMLPKFCYVVLK